MKLVRPFKFFLAAAAAACAFASAATAGDERVYLDFALPGANHTPQGFGLASPYQQLGTVSRDGARDINGVALGYSLPHETGEWRLAAGLSRQSAFGFESESRRRAVGFGKSDDDRQDTTAMVSMLYNFDMGSDSLFGFSMTPFVGGGIGVTRHTETAEGATESDAGVGETSAAEEYNLSWGLTAGVNMPLTSNLNLSLSYRYLGQGEPEYANDARDPNDPEGLHSHDLMLIFGVSF